MDRIRQLAEYISRQLAVLNLSQRLAIGLCAALVVVSILWLLTWSSAPDLVPVLNHNFNLDELSAAEDALRAAGVTHTVRGTRIYVRAADRHNALRILHNSDALPDGSLFDMATLVAEDNPFQSPEARAYAQNYAKGNELAKIIATYPQVQKASVLLNPITKRRLGGGSDVPTASVTVTLKPGVEMSPETVEAFARLVGGAVAGLKPHNVAVVDGRTIRSYSVPKPEDIFALDHWRMVQKLEERYLAKIRDKLAHIPGLLATVSVDLDTSRRVRRTNVFDPPQPRTEMQESREESSVAQPAEPGVQANIGQAVTAGPAGARTSTEQSTVENFDPLLRETETIEQGPLTRRVTAAIGIPRSFVVGVFRAKYPDRQDPAEGDPEFAAVRDEEVARVRASVERIVMAKSPDDVQVDVYPDMAWGENGPTFHGAPYAVAGTAGGTGGYETIEWLRGIGPQIGLGFLALLSLMMMMRIVRKSAKWVPERPEPVRHLEGEEPILTVGPGAVGQAERSESLLVAKELDEGSLRYAELSQEVSKLVQEDPESAADMIRQWLETPD